MPSLKVNMGRLELDNPVIISAGHFTRTGREVEKCDGVGAGAIITKSSFLEKEYEKVVKPYAPGLFPDARPFPGCKGKVPFHRRRVSYGLRPVSFAC